MNDREYGRLVELVSMLEEFHGRMDLDPQQTRRLLSAVGTAKAEIMFSKPEREQTYDALKEILHVLDRAGRSNRLAAGTYNELLAILQGG
ncbi:MAG: hypothetical protein ACLFVU_04100 [Phycisphaerae bacterium]